MKTEDKRKTIEERIKKVELTVERTERGLRTAQKGLRTAQKKYENSLLSIPPWISKYYSLKTRFKDLMEASDEENRRRIMMPSCYDKDEIVEEDSMYKRLTLVSCLSHKWETDKEILRLQRAFEERTLSEQDYNHLRDKTSPVLGDLLKKAEMYEKIPRAFKPIYRALTFSPHITWKDDDYPLLIKSL